MDIQKSSCKILKLYLWMVPGHHHRRGQTVKHSFQGSYSAWSHSHSGYTHKQRKTHKNSKCIYWLVILSIVSEHAQSPTRCCCDPRRRHWAGRAVHHADRCTGQPSHILRSHSGTSQQDRNSPPRTPSPPYSLPRPQTERDMSGHTHSHRPHTPGLQCTPALTISNQKRVREIFSVKVRLIS